MHTVLQISCRWEHISTWNMHINSLVKVPPYSKLNFHGKIFFTQNWCNITLKQRIISLREAMVFNATFNNISVISWWSVLLVVEIGVPGENHRPAASHWQTLSHAVSSTPRLSGIRTHNLSGCKSNYHTITTTTVLDFHFVWQEEGSTMYQWFILLYKSLNVHKILLNYILMV